MGGVVVDRADLLPRSGVGVEQHWLVIAPSGNPAIFLDLRVLDRIGVAPPGYADEESEESEDAAEHQPDHRSYLLLVCGELEAMLYVADGPESVAGIVRAAAPWSREQAGTPNTAVVELTEQATSVDGRDKRGVVHLDAEIEPATIRLATFPDANVSCLFVGPDAVTRKGEYLVVGKQAFALAEVRDYALKGANIPIAGGYLLQAALALMAVAAAERD